jgi:hypothetical protein
MRVAALIAIHPYRRHASPPQSAQRAKVRPQGRERTGSSARRTRGVPCRVDVNTFPAGPVTAVRCSQPSVEARRAGFDVDVPDAVLEDVPVECELNSEPLSVWMTSTLGGRTKRRLRRAVKAKRAAEEAAVWRPRPLARVAARCDRPRRGLCRRLVIVDCRRSSLVAGDDSAQGAHYSVRVAAADSVRVAAGVFGLVNLASLMRA